MNPLHPPRLATWLLQRLASSQKRESLTGDLAEQYRRGRSSAWYWRQVIIAIFVTIARDVRDHKWLTVRAVLTCWILLWYLGVFARSVHWSMAPLVQTWTAEKGFDTLEWGWFHYQPLVLVMLCTNAAFAGWAVARLHQERRQTMVLICAISVCVFASAPGFGYVWHWGYFAGYANNPSALSPINLTFNFIAIPLGILIGGLWGGRVHDVRRLASS